MEKKGVQIYIAIKNTSKAAKKVKEYPLRLVRKPRTLRELIEESVKFCLEAYKARAKSAKNPAPLTDEQIEEMREIGKLAFGVHYNEKNIDEGTAVQIATTAVADGLVRIFRGNEELAGLDNEIDLSEGDVITFVRLTMLSGAMW